MVSLVLCVVLNRFLFTYDVRFFADLIKSSSRLWTKKIKEVNDYTTSDIEDPAQFKQFCKPGQIDFYTWREKKINDITNTDYNLTDAVKVKQFMKDHRNVEVYLVESEENCLLSKDYACHKHGRKWMFMFQHDISGMLGLTTLFTTPDVDTQVYKNKGRVSPLELPYSYVVPTITPLIRAQFSVNMCVGPCYWRQVGNLTTYSSPWSPASTMTMQWSAWFSRFFTTSPCTVSFLSTCTLSEETWGVRSHGDCSSSPGSTCLW